MAEGLFRDLLQKRGISDVDVSSAGLSAFPGAPVSENAAAVLLELGIDIRGHRARAVGTEAPASDLIVALGESHAASLLHLYPGRAESIRLIGQKGIPDPYGGDLSLYRRTRDAIAAALPGLLPLVTGHA